MGIRSRKAGAPRCVSSGFWDGNEAGAGAGAGAGSKFERKFESKFESKFERKFCPGLSGAIGKRFIGRERERKQHARRESSNQPDRFFVVFFFVVVVCLYGDVGFSFRIQSPRSQRCNRL